MKRLMLWIATSFIFVNAFASTANYYDSQLMHVVITNRTNSICNLEFYQIIHGQYVNDVPTVINPNTSGAFDVAQYLSSHDVVLDYVCGTGEAKFEVTQAWATLFYGTTPDMTPIEQNNLKVSIESINSASAWAWANTPGMISIVLK